MKILLAGPGTGKTTKIKNLIKQDYSEAKNILVLSFTNATVKDLTQSFEGFSNVRCYTLHSYALIINHLSSIQILDDINETSILSRFAQKYNFSFENVCYFLQCITFDNMIESCLKFLKSNPAYGNEKIGDLDLLIVDEFQDFNLIERDLIYELSKYSKETLILGDDDQSIYGFKDADPLGIIELFNNKEVEKIPHENKCYRCPDEIIDSSTTLIKKNKNRIEKDWIKTGKEGKFLFQQTISSDETNQFVLEKIKDIKQNDPNGSILVLSPVRYYTEELINKLKSENIDNIDFWSPKMSPENVKKIWWLRAIFSDKKILNLTLLANTILSTHYRDKYNKLLAEAIQHDFDETKIIEQIVKIFPEPFKDYLITPPHILEFIKSHQEFSDLENFINFEDIEESLKSISKKLNPTVEFQKKLVNVMSIHKSKGLQADYVFILGLVEGVLPNKVKGLDTIEAQRRLLFVGMTRSAKVLYIMSQVEWEGKYVHKLDKAQFKYNHRKEMYSAKTSDFISEMTQ